MLKNLIIIAIIIVIFLILFRKYKEGFSGGGNPDINLDCYDTQVTNCSGNCEVLEKVDKRICLNSQKCDDLSNSETNCNAVEGCSFNTQIDSNCEDKTREQCENDSDICVWNARSGKCFEKEANYERQSLYDYCRQYNSNENACGDDEKCVWREPRWTGDTNQCASICYAHEVMCENIGNNSEACNNSEYCEFNTSNEMCRSRGCPSNYCINMSYGWGSTCSEKHHLNFEAEEQSNVNAIQVGLNSNTPIDNGNYNYEFNEGQAPTLCDGKLYRPTYYGEFGSARFYDGMCEQKSMFCSRKQEFGSNNGFDETAIENEEDDENNSRRRDIINKYNSDFEDNCFQLPIVQNYFNKTSTSPNTPGDNYLTKEFFDDPENLKLLPCVELKRIYDYSKTITGSHSDFQTAQKIINYVENTNLSGEHQRIVGDIFGPGTDKKCKLYDGCVNDCSDKTTSNECSGDCQWITDNGGYCVRKHDYDDGNGCVAASPCSITNSDGDEVCEERIEYDYRYCAPKINCDDGEYIDVDNSGNIVCQACPPGTKLTNNVCVNCGFGEYSDSGSTECSDKTDCAASQYVSVPTKPIGSSAFSGAQQKTLHEIASVMTDAMTINSDRQCVNLAPCSNTELVTNINSKSSESMQANYFGEFNKVDEKYEYLKTNPNFSQCEIPTPPSPPGSPPPAPPPSYSNDDIRFSNYTCEDLTKCGRNQYISNFSEHNNKISGMFVVDRSCSDQTNCPPGKYEESRGTNPVVQITDSDGTYDVHTIDRNCLNCEDNKYTDTTNATACALQPECSSGEKVELSVQDFVSGYAHELRFTNLAAVKKMLQLLGASDSHLDTLVNVNSLDVFFHIPDPVNQPNSGHIKYFTDNPSMNITLFEYTKDDTGFTQLKIPPNTEMQNVVFNSRNHILSFKVEAPNLTTFEAEIYVKHNIPKNRRINCMDCGEFTYQDVDTHRDIKCKDQPECNFGFYYPGDPQNKDSKVSCRECDDDTYIGPPDQTSLHRRLQCIEQPLLQQGQCSVTYDPADHTTKMTIVNADGDKNYQDETNHRNPCKTQPICQKGELISAINPNALRTCTEITSPVSNLLVDYKYMDIEGREQIGKSNFPCDGNQVLFIRQNENDPRHVFKTKARCIDEDCQLAALISEDGTCPEPQ